MSGTARRPAARALRCFVGRRQRQDPLEGRDAARAELGARGVAKLCERLVERPGGAVDAGREHRVERVGDVDDAGAKRDLLALEPVRIARAVEALVVVADRGTASPRKPSRSMMRAPSSACRCIRAHSSGVRLAGFSRIESGIASLPMSWKSAAWPSRSSSTCERPSSRPIASASCWTRREWPAVYASRASTVAERLSIAAVERSLAGAGSPAPARRSGCGSSPRPGAASARSCACARGMPPASCASAAAARRRRRGRRGRRRRSRSRSRRR